MNFAKKNTNQEYLTPKLFALSHPIISPYLYYEEINNFWFFSQDFQVWYNITLLSTSPNLHYTNNSSLLPNFSILFSPLICDLNGSYSNLSCSYFTLNPLSVFPYLYKHSSGRFSFLMSTLIYSRHVLCSLSPFLYLNQEESFNIASLNLSVFLSEPTRLTRGHSFTNGY